MKITVGAFLFAEWDMQINSSHVAKVRTNVIFGKFLEICRDLFVLILYFLHDLI
jgi:hypothetical protein